MLNLFRRKSHVSAPVQQVAEEATAQEADRILYRGIAPKDRWDQIEYAFTSGGVNYFKFVAEVNVPFQRAIAAKDIFTEELWQISPDFLRGWNNGLINLLMDKKKKDDKKLYEIGVLASRLKEQMDMSMSLVRQLKLATVVYFDEQENPLDYQYPYNKQKLNHWMKHNDVQGFFFESAGLCLSALFDRVQHEFPDLFAGRNSAKPKQPETHYWTYITRQHRQRFDEQFRVTAGDAQRLKFLVERPIYEYYLIISSYIAAQKSQRGKIK